MSKIIPSPQWLDKGTYKEPLDGDNIRVPRLEVDDATTFIDKDASNNMTFEDAVTGSKTLAELTRSLLSQGLASARPAAGIDGRLYYSTDTKVLERDNGTTWDEVARGETVTRLAQLSEKAHSSLTGVTADQHHAQAHTLASHSTKAHSELTGIGASDHHIKTTSFVDITDRAGASKLNWGAGKLLKGAGAGADPTEIDVPVEITEGERALLFAKL